MTRQRGLVLLPVTLALAIVGALAYSMTHDGAMTVTAIDAQYDIDRARYLTEAGINLIKWRNDMAACGTVAGFTGPVTALDGGTIAASGLTYKKGKGVYGTVTATTPRGTVNTIVLDEPHALPVYDLTKKVEVTIGSQNGNDTFIHNDAVLTTPVGYLETTDGKAHGLIKFAFNGIAANTMIVEATLRLYLGSIQSVQPGSLGIQRLLRSWPPSPGWTANWTNPGGDFVAQPSGIVPNILASKWYTVRIDGLVQGWINTPPNNFGLLLKPSNLAVARFNSFEAAANGPQLFLRYYPLCT